MMPAAGSQAMPVPDIGASHKTDAQMVARRPGHGTLPAASPPG